MIVINDKQKHKELTLKISKAQIILDRLKEAIKIGQKNINKLRLEREELKTRTHHE